MISADRLTEHLDLRLPPTLQSLTPRSISLQCLHQCLQSVSGDEKLEAVFFKKHLLNETFDNEKRGSCIIKTELR